MVIRICGLNRVLQKITFRARASDVVAHRLALSAKSLLKRRDVNNKAHEFGLRDLPSISDRALDMRKGDVIGDRERIQLLRTSGGQAPIVSLFDVAEALGQACDTRTVDNGALNKLLFYIKYELGVAELAGLVKSQTDPEIQQSLFKEGLDFIIIDNTQERTSFFDKSAAKGDFREFYNAFEPHEFRRLATNLVKIRAEKILDEVDKYALIDAIGLFGFMPNNEIIAMAEGFSNNELFALASCFDLSGLTKLYLFSPSAFSIRLITCLKPENLLSLLYFLNKLGEENEAFNKLVKDLRQLGKYEEVSRLVLLPEYAEAAFLFPEMILPTSRRKLEPPSSSRILQLPSPRGASNNLEVKHEGGVLRFLWTGIEFAVRIQVVDSQQKTVKWADAMQNMGDAFVGLPKGIYQVVVLDSSGTKELAAIYTTIS